MVPKYVNKYYFKIYGNYYIPLYQIVDGSTYNNTGSSNRKADVVSGKPILMAMKVFKYQYVMTTISNEEVKANVFVSNVFGKSISIFKFILTKYGLLETLSVSGLSGFINITETEPEDKENLYIFTKNDIFISVPKILFDSDDTLQSLVFTIYASIIKNTKVTDLFSHSFWLCSGGSEINAFTEERGLKLIESIEGIYDDITKSVLRLDERNKSDVYRYMLWMIKNFQSLMIKDNLDVRLKRIRISEYIASFYGVKLSTAIHQISDLGKRAKTQTIKRRINIKPNYLLTQLNRCSLVKYINVVDDSDTTQALCYTFKGNQGIGEKKSSTVSEAQKRLHPSSMYILDPSTSNKSEPGMSGMLCPYANVYEHGYLSEYEEPDNWDDVFGKLTQSYKELLGLREAIKFKDRLGIERADTEQIDMLNQSINTVSHILNTAINAENNSELIEAIIFV